ncbi:MAG TPA: DUF1508 domain-containing protein [Tissierellaceae bacterium]|nr:DUF1508 domain-containing protein [Tissierellaceae bacterium]
MRFEIKKSKNGQFYFNLLARNNKVVATSEMYTRKENALKTARLIAEETYQGIIDYTVNEDGEMVELEEQDSISLSKSEYEELMKAIIFLDSLEAHGVDNWVGYGDAHDDFESITGADYWDFDIDDYLKGE